MQVKVSQGQRSVVFSLGDVEVVLNVGRGAATDGCPGAVTVAKRGALLSKHDLALLARAMQLANDLQLRPALVRLCLRSSSPSLLAFFLLVLACLFLACLFPLLLSSKLWRAL
jgi:hypothetical protein